MKSDEINNRMEFFLKYMYITGASVVYGIAISLFLDKNNLVPGGISGLAIILNRLLKIETGTLIFLINVPILIIGAWKFGIRFILDTLYVIVLSSITINIFADFQAATEDKILAALIGGALLAYGMGVILKNGASSGGMDIIVQLVRLKYRHMRTAMVQLIADMIVIVLAFFVFNNIEIALYSVVTGFTCTMVLDKVLYGKDEAKLLYIILRTDELEKKLADRFIKELEAGVTYLRGVGAYNEKNKKVIMCAIRKSQLPKAKEIVRETDDKSFMIITSANEILGAGYKSHYAKSL